MPIIHCARLKYFISDASPGISEYIQRESHKRVGDENDVQRREEEDQPQEPQNHFHE